MRSLPRPSNTAAAGSVLHWPPRHATRAMPRAVFMQNHAFHCSPLSLGSPCLPSVLPLAFASGCSQSGAAPLGSVTKQFLDPPCAQTRWVSASAAPCVRGSGGGGGDAGVAHSCPPLDGLPLPEESALGDAAEGLQREPHRGVCALPRRLVASAACHVGDAVPRAARVNADPLHSMALRYPHPWQPGQPFVGACALKTVAYKLHVMDARGLLKRPQSSSSPGVPSSAEASRMLNPGDTKTSGAAHACPRGAPGRRGSEQATACTRSRRVWRCRTWSLTSRGRSGCRREWR